MTGFDIFDRYDFVITMLMGLLMSAIILLDGPLWAFVLVMFIGSLVQFIRHFDEIMGPDDEPPETDREPPKTPPPSRQLR